MAASRGPRYAPEDPSLPKPWRALVDGNTGYLYFWNPETNVTQYQKPDPLPLPVSAPKSQAAAVDSESESKPIPKSSPVEAEEDRHHTHIQNEEKEKDSRIPHQVFKLSVSCDITLLASSTSTCIVITHLRSIAKRLKKALNFQL